MKRIVLAAVLVLLHRDAEDVEERCKRGVFGRGADEPYFADQAQVVG